MLSKQIEIEAPAELGFGPETDVRTGIETPRKSVLTGGTPERSPELGKGPVRRGTTNRNARGGVEERRRRRAWLVDNFKSDVAVILVELFHGPLMVPVLPGTPGALATCRCYRCGALLTAETVTVDRIVPGCQGGTYRRSNIRPACGTCNSSTGATTRRKR